MPGEGIRTWSTGDADDVNPALARGNLVYPHRVPVLAGVARGLIRGRTSVAGGAGFAGLVVLVGLEVTGPPVGLCLRPDELHFESRRGYCTLVAVATVETLRTLRSLRSNFAATEDGDERKNANELGKHGFAPNESKGR